MIVTTAFTCQQLLLAAYLDELGYLERIGLISGIILAIYYLFWFIFGPIFGTLSDLYGRKFLMIASNLVVSFGFIGLGLTQEPLFFFFLNALLGFGTSIRSGSGVALWIQHSPQDRVGESLAYNNILQAISGIGGAVLGFILWSNIEELSFVFFGVLLFISAIPIIFISDSGDYVPFSFTYTLNLVRNSIQSIKEKINNSFFLSKPIFQISIHWLAFATIVSFSTFTIPIIERILEQLPIGSELLLPLPLLFVILTALIISCVGGLLIWGRISDSWARRPVLVIGYAGTVILILLAILLIQFNWLPLLIDGLLVSDPISLVFIGIILFTIFLAISIVPTPMAWISDIVGQNNLGKVMSLRLVLMGAGTVLGTLIGAQIIGTFGINGLFLIILLLLIISAVILL